MHQVSASYSLDCKESGPSRPGPKLEKNGSGGGGADYEQWGGGPGPFHHAVYGSDFYFPASSGGHNSAWGPSSGSTYSYASEQQQSAAAVAASFAGHYSPFLGGGGGEGGGAGAWGALVPPHDPRPLAKDFYGGANTAGYRLPDSYTAPATLHDGLHALALGHPPQDPPAAPSAHSSAAPPKPATWADKVKSTPKEASKGLKKIPIGSSAANRSGKDGSGFGHRTGTVPLSSNAPAPAARFGNAPAAAPQPLIPPAPPQQQQQPREHAPHPPPPQLTQPNLSQPPPALFRAPQPPLQPPHNGWPAHFDQPLQHSHQHHLPPSLHHHQHHPHLFPPPQHHHMGHFNGDAKVCLHLDLN